LIAKLSHWIKQKLQLITFKISKTTTAVVLVLGALVDIKDSERLTIAGLILLFGLPIGFIIFGAAFNMLMWLSIVVVILFAVNLHNAWEVASTLRHGGLDYQMASQAIAAVQTVLPTKDNIEYLNEKIGTINQNFINMTSKQTGYDGKVLMPLNTISPLLKG